MTDLTHICELLGVSDRIERAKLLDELVTRAGVPGGVNLLVRAVTETELRKSRDGSVIEMSPEAEAELYDFSNAILFEVVAITDAARAELIVEVNVGDLVTAPNKCPIPMSGRAAPCALGVLHPKMVGVVLSQARSLDACRTIQYDREITAKAAEEEADTKRMRANGLIV